ncbi:hypothetical protein KIH39_16265 [Telmatocola sphagniphila]|uniref:Trm112 family protein n=1 Tax=Telmatocola sphagniphila TaxID=1123043 RepID=A0A8E6B2V1_9BACT|nr:hypothetical protein [Telmatocola sphagniphila]QVL30404.1 hypothetical protein KIH39_16265 [Telmatocola sphagniphila]
MITPETLAVLRCPNDPRRESKLILEEDVKIFCERCRIQFKSKEGLPSLLLDEAILPEGCTSLKSLPCRTGEAAKV